MLSQISSSQLRVSTSSSLRSACLTSSLLVERVAQPQVLPPQTASISIRWSRTRSSSPYTSKLSVRHLLGSPDHPLIPLIKQMSCTRHLRAIHFLFFLSAVFTVSRTCSGRVPVARIQSKDHNGVDTAPTDLCFSRLGTGPM